MNDIAEAPHVKPLQIVLAWTIRTEGVISIPKAVKEPHIFENAKAATILFTQEELDRLDVAFPKPPQKVPLDII
ncbi:aldo/keto reductase [Bacillus sp. V5-8f]|uniref:aldo/keto reductase n=1 Tax=Bacillus sp. V5-8f TaxID=2053044 RepID=UPI00115B167B|nr:aldo/keto reductase [Bacillus sp. V5-8f]